MIKTRQYYTLVSYDERLKDWVIEFGDYSLRTVRDEKRDFYANQRTFILTSKDTQDAIDAAVEAHRILCISAGQ